MSDLKGKRKKSQRESNQLLLMIYIKDDVVGEVIFRADHMKAFVGLDESS